MSLNLATLIALCSPLVHPVTMHALVTVESAAQPYAISVNYPERLALAGRSVPHLQRQPHSFSEALAWAHWFLDQGYTVSVGIAQINVERLAWLQQRRVARSLTELFEPCVNLRAAQAILVECWERAPTDPQRGIGPARLHRTLSCYNSGNGFIGLRNGYVQRMAHVAQRASESAGHPRPGS